MVSKIDKMYVLKHTNLKKNGSRSLADSLRSARPVRSLLTVEVSYTYIDTYLYKQVLFLMHICFVICSSAVRLHRESKYIYIYIYIYIWFLYTYIYVFIYIYRYCSHTTSCYAICAKGLCFCFVFSDLHCDECSSIRNLHFLFMNHRDRWQELTIHHKVFEDTV